MRTSILTPIVTAIAVTMAGCSGGGSSAPTPPPEMIVTPPPPPPVAPTLRTIDFTPIQNAAEAFSVEDVTVLIGDEEGVVFTFERGTIGANTQLRIASASKMAFGLIIWTMIESGDLALSDSPQDYISFWTDVEPGGRSSVTLDQLLGFISGFNNSPADPECIGRLTISLPDCVQEIHDGGLDGMPGDDYYYGPESTE